MLLIPFFILNALPFITSLELIDLTNILDPTHGLVWDPETNYEYEVAFYSVEIFKGEMFGTGVEYEFHAPSFEDPQGISPFDKYILLNNVEVSATFAAQSLNWDEAIATQEAYLRLHSTLVDYDVLVVRHHFEDDKYRYAIYQLLQAKYSVSIEQCLGESVQLDFTSSLMVNDPQTSIGSKFILLGNTCEPMIINNDTPHINFQKSTCGLSNADEFNFAVITGPIIRENIQVFKLFCVESHQTIIETDEIGNINNLDTLTQSITDFVIPTISILDQDTLEPITEAVLGSQIRLVISIPEAYRMNFDIFLQDCSMDSVSLTSGMLLLNRIVSTPVKPSIGVYYLDMTLFREYEDFAVDKILEFSCSVLTCLNSCESKRRRRDLSHYLYPKRNYHKSLIIHAILKQIGKNNFIL